jgi:hypothetical protein
MEAKDGPVLCSASGVSSILVFRRGSVAPVAELAQQPDINYLQMMINGWGTIAFALVIVPADPLKIRQYIERRAGDNRAFVHAGIKDTFVGKGSVVWYWDGSTSFSIHGARRHAGAHSPGAAHRQPGFQVSRVRAHRTWRRSPDQCSRHDIGAGSLWRGRERTGTGA